MKKLPLYLWGLCLMAGSAVSGGLLPKPTDGDEALGQVAGQLFLMAIGMGLIVAHFARRNRTY